MMSVFLFDISLSIYLLSEDFNTKIVHKTDVLVEVEIDSG